MLLIGADDDYGRSRIGHDGLDFCGRQAPIEAHQDGPNLATAKHDFEKLRGVLGEHRNAITPPHSTSESCVGHLRAPIVQLAEREGNALK